MDGATDTARFAFVCAMPMELRPLVRTLHLAPTAVRGFAFRHGELRGERVVGMVVGIGTERARQGTRQLLEVVEVGHVVVVGIAGAVDDLTPIGALVQPRVVVSGATGVEHTPAGIGDATPHGTLWTSDEIQTDPSVIADLRARGVVALDMETAAVAEVCESASVPWSVIRAISDRATDGSVNPEVLRLSNADGTPNVRAAARYIMRHPGQLPRLLQLARGARVAAAVAADTAVVACSNT